MKEKRSILFLSALDFKEKSIQVIRKTPEAFASTGWHVSCVVARDNSRFGTYFYEKEISPRGVEVLRFSMPFTNFINRIRHPLLRTIVSKLRSYLTILQLAIKGCGALKHKPYGVIYGYEIHGVLAVNILKLFGYLKGKKIISRFQGSFFYLYYENRDFFKILLNAEHMLAMFLPSDMCFMTNDGTRGDDALRLIRSRNLKHFKFWVNGVDISNDDEVVLQRTKASLNISCRHTVCITVCRLEKWKRVDRGIEVIFKVVKEYNIDNIYYLIVGDGIERENLEKLVSRLGLNGNVRFMGAIEHRKAMTYLNMADIAISTYEHSNVGNPLLESILSQKVIFTLDNGDTRSWIRHGENGFIYQIKEGYKDQMAADIAHVIQDKTLKASIVEAVRETAKSRLWSWDQRLSAEVQSVANL